MKQWVLAAGIAALSLGAVSVGAVWAQDVVAQREADMKRMGSHLQAIKAVVDASGPVAPVAERAADMRDYFARMTGQFPAGSADGSKALPAVWSDNAGFERAASNAAAAAGKLASAASANDSSAVAAAFREVAASCGACHRGYRAR